MIRDFSILSIYRFLKKGIGDGENQGKGKQEEKHYISKSEIQRRKINALLQYQSISKKETD